MTTPSLNLQNLHDAPSYSASCEEAEDVKGVLTRARLCAAVQAREPRLARAEAQKIINDILESIVDALVSGEPVRLHGFGRFDARSKRARVGRNPKTKVEALICARRVVTFKASRGLVHDVNDACERVDDEPPKANGALSN